MKKLAIIIIWSILVCPGLMPYSFAQDILATLQVDRVDNKLTVSSWVYNRSKADRVLSYQVSFLSSLEGHDFKKFNQNGRLSVGHGQQAKLATQTVPIQNGQQVKIHLSVMEGDRVVAIDSFPKEPMPIVREPKVLKDLQAVDGSGSPKDPSLSSAQYVELGGFVFEQTKTPWGQQFFQLFAQQWQQLDIQTTANVLIEEVPFQGRNTMVKVKVNDQEIFSQVLQSKYDFLEELANYAIQVTIIQVQQLNQVEQDLFDQNVNDIEIY